MERCDVLHLDPPVVPEHKIKLFHNADIGDGLVVENPSYVP